MIKIKTVVLIIVISIIIIFAFESCKLSGTSKDERIDNFESDLNNDRNNLYKNFHPSKTEKYNDIKDPAYLEAYFPTDNNEIPYDIYDVDISGDTVNARIVSNNLVTFPDQTINFKMAEDGSDWQIEELTLNENKIVW